MLLLRDHTNKTFTDPAKLSVDKSRSFIQCTKAPFFPEAAERAQQEGFRFRELFVAGHDAMITQPRALAAILMDFSSPQAATCTNQVRKSSLTPSQILRHGTPVLPHTGTAQPVYAADR
jgi:hypothetical protein